MRGSSLGEVHRGLPDFVSPNNRVPRAIALPITMYIRNLHLRARKASLDRP